MTVYRFAERRLKPGALDQYCTSARRLSDYWFAGSKGALGLRIVQSDDDPDRILRVNIWRSGAEVFGLALGSLPRQLLFLDGASAIYWVAAGLAFGAAGLALSRPAATPGRLGLVLWGPFQLVLVAALGVAYYPWYAIPLYFSALLLGAQAFELPWLHRLRQPRPAFALAPTGRAVLGGVAGAAAMLLLPTHPLCREDCAGLCPRCGADRNRVACGCAAGETDPRWAALAAFKAKDGGH